MALFERWRPTQKLDYEIPVVLFNNIIPFKGFRCINLFGILFMNDMSEDSAGIGKWQNYEKE